MMNNDNRSRSASGNPYARISDGEGGQLREISDAPLAACRVVESLTASPTTTLNLDAAPSGNPYASLGNYEGVEATVTGHAGLARDIFYFGSLRPSIEKSARELHLELWKSRKSIWGKEDINPLQVIDPKAAAVVLGVNLEEVDPLGRISTEDGEFEIAGIFNRPEKRIAISTRLPRPTWRFTAGHELGHWILHPGAVELHRDQPLDGSNTTTKNPVEQQANWFSSAFLMPRKPVVQSFIARFGPSIPLKMSKEIAFGLAPGGFMELLDAGVTSRAIAFTLASAIYFEGNRFSSLAEEFCVSVSAMAYRLLELGLIEEVA